MGKDNVSNGFLEKYTVDWKHSVRTKLIILMLLIAIIPISVSNTMNYFTSVDKAYDDTVKAMDWQANYIGAEFEAIVDENIRMLETIAAAPSTINYMKYPDNPDFTLKTLNYLVAADSRMGDGNGTVLTGPDGMQLLRANGKLVDVHERDYFKQAMAGNSYCSDVIVSASTGLRQCTFSVPVYDEDGTILGIAQRNFDLNVFHEFLASKSEDAFITDRTGLVAAHSQYAITAENEDDRSKSQFMTSGLSKGNYSVDSGKGYDAVLAYIKASNGWTICAATDTKLVSATAQSSALITEIVGFIMTLVAAAISIFVAGSFVKPVMEVNRSIHDLAEGHFKKIERFLHRKDEFGQMIDNTNSVIDTLEEIVGSIKKTATDVSDSSKELSEMAGQISQTTEDVSNAVQEIASGATQQASEIQSANESVKMIGDAVINVQNSSNDLTNLAEKMKEASEHSGRSLSSLQASSNDMTGKIDDISSTIQATQEAVSKINDKVEGISSIATQTNLLSLNASIEAARAGDAGKGFAVVAEEIGKLAEDSKKMAEDIRNEMDVLLNQSKAAVEAADHVKQGNIDQQVALSETSDAVSGMLEDINSTVDGVKLISNGADTCETSKNAVVENMVTLSDISEQNAASSEETGASMQELSATVTTLAESASQLNTIAEKLIDKISFFK